MLCADEGLLEKKKKKKVWEDSILGWPLHFPIHWESLWGKVSREKNKEKNNAARAKNKKLWVNKKRRSDGFEAT